MSMAVLPLVMPVSPLLRSTAFTRSPSRLCVNGGFSKRARKSLNWTLNKVPEPGPSHETSPQMRAGVRSFVYRTTRKPHQQITASSASGESVVCLLRETRITTNELGLVDMQCHLLQTFMVLRPGS